MRVKKAKNFRPRDYPALVSFLATLKEKIEGFASLSIEHQLILAFYIWTAGNNRRRHKRYGEYTSLGYKELEKVFGRNKFPEINKALQIFDVTSNWRHFKGETKGYKLTERIQTIKDEFLAQEPSESSVMGESLEHCRQLYLPIFWMAIEQKNHG